MYHDELETQRVHWVKFQEDDVGRCGYSRLVFCTSYQEITEYGSKNALVPRFTVKDRQYYRDAINVRAGKGSGYKYLRINR